MTRVLVATISAAVLSCVMIVAAQTQAPAQRGAPDVAQLRGSATGPPLQIISGCLKPGPAPGASVPGANTGTFVLENATMEGPVGTSGTSSARATYRLEGLASPGTNLADMVNKKVEVKGAVLADRSQPTFSMRIVKKVAETCQ